jgi:DNA-binding NarL/FixJ family response regulator
MEKINAQFTNREKEIVRQLAEGFSSDEVAERLFISSDTVKTHRKNVIEKTGARNMVHLVWLASSNGWLKA